MSTLTDHDLDLLVRAAALAAPPTADPIVRERVWHTAMRNTPRVGSRPRRRTPVRVLVFAALTVLVLAGVAGAANPKFVQRVFTKDSRPVERMQVFRQPAVRLTSVTPTPSIDTEGPAPAMPPALRADMEQDWKLMPEMMTEQEGALRPASDSRMLVDYHDRGKDVQLFAVPTTKGGYCMRWTGDINGGGCQPQPFSLERPIDPSAGSLCGQRVGCHTTRVFGIAADEVTAVTVELDDGTSQEAVMGTNAYFWLGEWSDAEAMNLVVHLSDGTSSITPIRSPGQMSRARELAVRAQARLDCAGKPVRPNTLCAEMRFVDRYLATGELPG